MAAKPYLDEKSDVESDGLIENKHIRQLLTDWIYEKGTNPEIISCV